MTGTGWWEGAEGTVTENLNGLRETIRASRTVRKMLLEASEKGS